MADPMALFRWKQGRLRNVGWYACITVLLLLTGCASTRQTQYFEVVYEDPDTGETQTNYYRMTVRGGASNPFGPVVYKLKAAYLNAATLDVLEGKRAFVPEANLPLAADETFKKVLGEFRKALEARATTAATAAGSASMDDSNYDYALIEAARQAWFASLSDSDIVSIGQTRSDDPHEFRKLVFYATAKNLDLQKTIGPQIDSMISKVQTLARREQRRAGARQAQRQGLQNLARTILSDNPAALALVNTFFAATEEPPASGGSESASTPPLGGTDGGG